jgi:ribosomal protein S2
MKFTFLVSTLFELGVHIGAIKNRSLSTSNFFILGNRHGIDIIDINKSIFFLQKTLFFLRELGKVDGRLLFYYTSLPTYNSFIKIYLVNLISNSGDQSFFDEKWSFGQLSNFRIHAFKMLNDLFSMKQQSSIHIDFKMDLKKTKLKKVDSNRKSPIISPVSSVRFFDLFLRILFSTYIRYIDGINWDLYFHVVRKYWRFVLFFKFFKCFYQMPDAFILANPNHHYAPVLESSRLQIPIISLIDTDSKPNLISYPIFTNDDSVILVLFYFQLFINSYLVGKNSNVVLFQLS